MPYRDDDAGLRARHAWLSELRIAAPCDASWEAMSGDDRARRCGLCDRTVYDLSRMTSAEAVALLAPDAERRPCVRLHRRRDGTVITSDCARGVSRRKRRLAIAGAAAACAVSIAAWGEGALELLAPPTAEALEDADAVSVMWGEPDTSAYVRQRTAPPRTEAHDDEAALALTTDDDDAVGR